MTERVRRRPSKWDLKGDPGNFSIGTIQDDASINKTTESIHENESKQEWISKNTGSHTKWSDTNTDGGFKPEGNSRRQGWEPTYGNRAELNGDNISIDVNEVSQNMKKWDENRSYSTSISPGRDGWRQQSRSSSPRRGWSNSHRSRSRTPPHGLRKRSRTPPHGLRYRSRSPPHGLRSRSRSPPRGLRNRSRSPSHDFKRDPAGRNDRIRGESRVPVCNDFTKGRCRRGGQCRFLHEETNGYDGRRPPGSVAEENWGSRHQGGSYGHPNNVERDYSRDRLSHGHDSQKNNGMSDRCMNFIRGNCHRGSSCRFIHENATADGRGTSDLLHERDTRSYSGHDQRREPYRTIIPCKYFASGNCRKGISCRFSHEGAAHDQSQGGPNWRGEAADSAQGSAEGRPLNYALGHIANNAWDGSEWNKKLTNNDDKAADARSQARSADGRWVHNASDENKSWGGPKRGDQATDSASGVEGRPVNDGRDRISNSGWDNSTYNKTFVGWIPNDQAMNDRPEGRSAEESLDHNTTGDEKKSHEGTKWGVEAAGSANYSVEGRSVNDGRGQISNTTCSDPRWMKQTTGSTWNDEAADLDVKKIPKLGNDGKSEQVGDDEKKLLGDKKWSNNVSAPEVSKTPEWTDDRNDNDVKDVVAVPGPPQRSLGDRGYSLDDQNRTWGDPTWSTSASEPELAKAPVWRNDNDVKNDIAVSCPMSRSLDVKTGYNLDDQNRTWGVPTWSNMPSDQDVHKSTQLSRGHEELASFTNQRSAGAGREQYPHFIGNEKAGFGVHVQQSHVPMLSHGQYSTQDVSSQHHHPTIPMYPEGEKHPATSAITHPTVSNMISQSQQALLCSSPTVRSFDLNGPVEDVPSPKPQSLFHMVETIKAGKVDPKLPPITTGPIVTQSIVTSEQVAQISHISASLAQIFGNGQQLPQLYATLNSTSSAGLVAPSGPNSGGVGAPVGGSFVQSNQDAWPQKQYGPVSSSIESSQISIQPPGFSEKPIGWTNTADHESQTQPQSSVLSSVTVGPNGSDPAINGNLQKTFQQGNELKQLDSVGNERAVESIVKEQDNARSGDTNADGRMDEDDKKSKETKAMRMFKFALVEFVKEILKPTWREGQLSKEAHKTIVKKVVDKVTGAVQGEHIPSTQEKIDQYMAYSKTKLAKLVEAYVEKYVKS